MRPENLTQATQRLGVTAEMPALLRETGVDPAAVFAVSGIDPDSLTPDTRLPLQTIGLLLERAAHLSGLPHFGLLLGMRFRLAHHGIIGRLMKTAPTVRHALYDFVAWQPGYSSGAIVFLSRWGDDHAFGYAVHDRFETGRRQIYDCVMAIGWRMLDELSGGKARPFEFHLSGRQPADAAPYARHVRTTVRFDQQNTQAILDSAAMETRLPEADAGQRSLVLARIEAMMEEQNEPVLARVRRAMRGALLEGSPQMPDVAARLNLHSRTLRRRLASEGVTFETVRDQVRFVVARELLEMTALSMGEIASALAFSTQGVFSDAFRRWSGKSPSQWRARPGDPA